VARLEPRLGRSKAIVAIARKMPTIVWHILSRQVAEKQLDLERPARKYYEFAYSVGKDDWGACKTATAFIRHRFDCAGIGQDLMSFTYCGKRVVLPPSSLLTYNNEMSGVTNR
jgi:hypothetical protein